MDRKGRGVGRNVHLLPRGKCLYVPNVPSDGCSVISETEKDPMNKCVQEKEAV